LDRAIFDLVSKWLQGVYGSIHVDGQTYIDAADQFIDGFRDIPFASM